MHSTVSKTVMHGGSDAPPGGPSSAREGIGAAEHDAASRATSGLGRAQGAKQALRGGPAVAHDRPQRAGRATGSGKKPGPAGGATGVQRARKAAADASATPSSWTHGALAATARPQRGDSTSTSQKERSARLGGGAPTQAPPVAPRGPAALGDPSRQVRPAGTKAAAGTYLDGDGVRSAAQGPIIQDSKAEATRPGGHLRTATPQGLAVDGRRQDAGAGTSTPRAAPPQMVLLERDQAGRAARGPISSFDATAAPDAAVKAGSGTEATCTRTAALCSCEDVYNAGSRKLGATVGVTAPTGSAELAPAHSAYEKRGGAKTGAKDMPFLPGGG